MHQRKQRQFNLRVLCAAMLDCAAQGRAEQESPVQSPEEALANAPPRASVGGDGASLNASLSAPRKGA